MFNPTEVESEAVIDALLEENKELTRTKTILSVSLSNAYQEIQRLQGETESPGSD